MLMIISKIDTKWSLKSNLKAPRYKYREKMFFFSDEEKKEKE